MVRIKEVRTGDIIVYHKGSHSSRSDTRGYMGMEDVYQQEG